MTKLMKYGYAGALAVLLGMLAAPAFGAASIGLEGLLSFIVYLVVVGLIFWVIWWFLSYVGVPEPFNKVIRVIMGLIALIIVVNLLLGLVGSPMFTLGR